MLTPDHEVAERLAAQAEMLLRQGDPAQARSLYGEAAAAEQRAAAAFAGQNKARTFNILAVSHASLLYKSNQIDLAEQWTCVYLAHPTLNAWGRSKMRELLEVIWDEQTVERQGREYSGEEIWIALRGGEVGSGTAPVEVALHYMNSANQLVYRAVEWTAKFSFRRRGAAPASVLQALQARATQPVPGSYRFSVRLLKPEQMRLFPGEQPKDRIEPAAVATFVVDFLRAASGKRGEDVEDVVPDREYRQALLQLARNLLPRNPSVVREIEVLRVSHGHSESALLLSGAREPIGRGYSKSQAAAATRS